MGKELERKSL